jgi:hypothetical protein
MVAIPLSDTELLRRADVAGIGRVISVRDGYARLRFTRFLKYRPPSARWWARLFKPRFATVRLRARHYPMTLGDWSDEGAYQVGRTVKVFLAWNEDTRAYETCWWNGVSWVEP